MNDLKGLFVERLIAGLRRKTLTTPSRWACANRVMGEPFPGLWTFKYHPWLWEMHDSTNELNVGQKGAQLGFTETILNIVFFNIDVLSRDCLYVLPAKTPDAGDFSSGRFDQALELSPYLSRLFSDVKNVGHKRAGSTNLYIRGSKSRAGLKSVPTGLVVLDEVDEFNQKNISLAMERVSGQREKQIWMVSTPTVELRGINRFYQDSTQDQFFFRCPSCSRYIQFLFPDNLEIHEDDINTSYLKCTECDAKLPHETKHEYLSLTPNGSKINGAKWIPSYCDKSIRGFHVNQLYSSAVGGNPVSIAKAYLKSQDDPTEEQTFWNEKIGVPHTVESAKLNDKLIDLCKGDHLNHQTQFRGIVTIGIDIGKWIHYWVDEWFIDTNIPYNGDISVLAKARTLEINKVLDFNELAETMFKYRPTAGVIDAHPERRKSFEFSQKFHPYIKMCFYGQGVNGKQINEPKNKLNKDEPTITVDRTSWLDLSLSRFRNGTIRIPRDTPYEANEHLKTMTRIYERDKDGNPVGRYVSGTEDHYAHARNYSEIALPFAAYISNPKNIKSPI